MNLKNYVLTGLERFHLVLMWCIALVTSSDSWCMKERVLTSWRVSVNVFSSTRDTYRKMGLSQIHFIAHSIEQAPIKGPQAPITRTKNDTNVLPQLVEWAWEYFAWSISTHRMRSLASLSLLPSLLKFYTELQAWGQCLLNATVSRCWKSHFLLIM